MLRPIYMTFGSVAVSMFLSTVTIVSYAEPPAPRPCVDCHTRILEKAFVHMPAQQDCTFCHAPHWPQQQPGNEEQRKVPFGLDISIREQGKPPKFIKDLNQIYLLCLSCHDKDQNPLLIGCRKTVKNPEGRCGHPVYNHPTTGRKDILYPEKGNVRCSSCHNPHSSNMPKLFRYDYEYGPGMEPDGDEEKTHRRIYATCKICHNEILFGHPLAPEDRPDWGEPVRLNPQEGDPPAYQSPDPGKSKGGFWQKLKSWFS